MKRGERMDGCEARGLRGDAKGNEIGEKRGREGEMGRVQGNLFTMSTRSLQVKVLI